jgi:hypothetical protein
MIRKVVKPWNEVQLGFTFLVEEEASSPVVRDRETGKAQKSREVKPTPDNLRDAIALTQAQLLDAPLGDVSSRLLPLLELCEAALTRALDVVAIRETEPLFSGEELRSLRGIGQAQWILSEKLARRGTKSEEKTTRRKRTMNDEQSSQ